MQAQFYSQEVHKCLQECNLLLTHLMGSCDSVLKLSYIICTDVVTFFTRKCTLHSFKAYMCANKKVHDYCPRNETFYITIHKKNCYN